MKKIILGSLLALFCFLHLNMGLAAACFCNGVSCVQHQDPQQPCPDPQACGAGCIGASADGTGRQ